MRAFVPEVSGASFQHRDLPRFQTMIVKTIFGVWDLYFSALISEWFSALENEVCHLQFLWPTVLVTERSEVYFHGKASTGDRATRFLGKSDFPPSQRIHYRNLSRIPQSGSFVCFFDERLLVSKFHLVETAVSKHGCHLTHLHGEDDHGWLERACASYQHRAGHSRLLKDRKSCVYFAGLATHVNHVVHYDRSGSDGHAVGPTSHLERLLFQCPVSYRGQRWNETDELV